MKTILNLVILNLIQIILTVTILVLLASCAPPEARAPQWLRSLETLPRVDGFTRAGIVTINGKLYVQNCDVQGNQIWMRYDKKTHTWSQSRYNSLGCVRSESATGPKSG